MMPDVEERFLLASGSRRVEIIARKIQKIPASDLTIILHIATITILWKRFH